MQFETGDVRRDYDAKKGVDFNVAFQLVPLDLTGCTGVMSITGLVDLTFDVQPSRFGAFAQGGLAAHASAATTTAWAAGIYEYENRITFPGGQVYRLGHGKVVVS